MGAASTTSNDTGAFTVITDGIEGTDYAYASGVLTIKSATPITIQNTNTGSTTDRIEVDLTSGSDANITLAGVNISTGGGPALKIKDNAGFNVNITLADGSENTLTATADDYAGLQKNSDSDVGMLTITGSTGENAGKLTATGGYAGAGIGSRYDSSTYTVYDVSNITISGGTVTATGGGYAAGIGGGNAGNVSNITISGGTVTAKGGTGGSGIGGGNARNGSDITISGGTVTATGGENGAGIGGGSGGNGNEITISGGSVTSTGENGGAGIGGGNGIAIASGNGTNITISGGSITATGGYLESGSAKASGAGIGSGAIMGTASNNELNGNAVVLATSGEDDDATGGVKPLDGFADSDRTGGIVFTGVGTYEDDGTGTWVLKSTTWNEGTQYGNVTITEDITFPADLKIDSTEALTIGKNAGGKEATLSMAEGKKLTVEGTLINEGVIDIPAENLTCNDTGKVTIKTDFYRNGSTEVYKTGYQTYQTKAGVQKYTNLPNPDVEAKRISDIKADKFSNWYYLDGEEKVAIKDGDNVLLNQHTFYEETVPAPDPEPEPTPGTEDGWVQSDAGWQYVLNGEYLNDGWHYFEDEYGNHWYYFDADTYMATSRWIWDDAWEGWYWVCSTGPMIENLWQWIDNAWYGFWWGGKMCQGWVWDTAWQEWYYCDDYTGRVACNEWAWDGAWYYFDQNCHMQSSCWVGDYWLNFHGMWV